MYLESRFVVSLFVNKSPKNRFIINWTWKVNWSLAPCRVNSWVWIWPNQSLLTLSPLTSTNTLT